MRIVYFGSPADAVTPLRALVANGDDVALVVTQPDRRRGRRGGELLATPVKLCAQELGLRVVTPQKSIEIIDEVAALEAQLGVVVAFGQILPPELLAATRSGFVNLHFSLLPRWRGAAPVERAIIAGDHETGVAVMAMEAGLDTGGIFAEARLEIGDNVTAGELRSQLVDIGTSLLVESIDAVPKMHPRPQVGDPVYAHKLSVEEFRLDTDRPVGDLARVVRAGNPKPGAWVVVDGQRLKVLGAHVVDRDLPGIGAVSKRAVLNCRDGGLLLDEVQPNGKRPMSGMAWRSGKRNEVNVDGVNRDV